MNTENAYLLFTHYGITEQDNISEMIEKVSGICYLDFCRRVSFQRNTPVDKRDELQKETDMLLSDRIPKLLQSTNDAVNGKEVFDKLHHEICEDIKQIYKHTGGQPYGIAQRWLNLILMQLVVIESNLADGKLPIAETRKYFHVPVDQHLLAVAASKIKRYQHGLQLKCAPLFHEKDASYQMDWFKSGKTQPYEYWDYPEYLEFQSTVQNRIAEIGANQDNPFHYQDTLDWVFNAYVEKKQIRYYSRS